MARTSGWTTTPGERPAVILVHAGWAGSAEWDGVITLLSGVSRIIRYDNRGYGHSPAPAANFSWDTDLLAVLDHLAIDSAILVGHSGGGGAALSVALNHPDRVDRLVLIAPGATTTRGPARTTAGSSARSTSAATEPAWWTWACARGPPPIRDHRPRP